MNEASGADAPVAAEDAAPGALLRRERERRALSVQQTAEDLHLDPWIIEAIEANRFHALGAPVYAKGHLRKYAARLGLPVEDLVARYEALHDRPIAADPIPTAVAAPVRPPRRPWKFPLRAALLVVLAGGLGWLLLSLFGPGVDPLLVQPSLDSSSVPAPQAVTRPVAQSQALLASQLPGQLPSEAPVPAPAAEPAAADPLRSDAAAASVPAEASAGAGDGVVQLRLEFSGESWTEVYDAQGQRLMFAMGTPGRARTLSGVPPLQITLGAASVVTAHVNGRVIAIPQRDGRDSARFAVGADGVLR